MRYLLLLYSCLTFASSPENTLKSKAGFDHLSNFQLQPESFADEPEDARSKTTILAYFDYLITNGMVLTGQQCGEGPDQTNSYYQEYVGRLAGKTDRYVGLMGADLGFFPSRTYPVNTLIDHWREGGLVTLSWSADNPFQSGYDSYGNTVAHNENIQLRALLKKAPESHAKTTYREELDRIALALQKLQRAGVVVIWRPFHEMNAANFWWGIDAYGNEHTNDKDFKALWQDLYHTLTYDYGLKNLIWTYAVVPSNSWNANVTAYYPGSDYVDLVGMDYYGSTPDFPDFEALKSLGKTLVMSETGPKSEAYGNWDQLQLMQTLAGKAAYFLQWHSWDGAEVAIKDNKKANAMMRSEKAITRDELRLVNFAKHQ